MYRVCSIAGRRRIGALVDRSGLRALDVGGGNLSAAAEGMFQVVVKLPLEQRRKGGRDVGVKRNSAKWPNTEGVPHRWEPSEPCIRSSRELAEQTPETPWTAPETI